MGRYRWVLLAMMAICHASSARADAVGMPPTDCPNGSWGESCHGGEFCTPSYCTDDGDCDDGRTCEVLDVCVARIDCAGGWNPEGEHYWNDTFQGLCTEGPDDCITGVCQAISVCVSSDDASLSGRYACGCRAAGSSTSGWTPAAVLAVAVVALATRRRLERG